MQIDHLLDFDAVIDGASTRLQRAVKGWKKGVVTEEPALLNRLIEQLGHGRWQSDLGTRTKVRVQTKLAVLHRRGERATDKHGADLALTIAIDELNYLKTSLFQIKISDGLHVTVEKDQVKRAVSLPNTKGRSFTIAFSKDRHLVRVESTAKLWPQMQNVETQKTFDTIGWMPFTDWLSQWLKCAVGEASQRNDPQSIESLLQQFVEEPESDMELPWVLGGNVVIPSEFVPPDYWIQYLLRSDQSNDKS